MKEITPHGTLMSDKEIAHIIRVILSTAEIVVKQLKAEKKEKGDYSKEVAIQNDGIDIVFYADTFRGSYPPISVNLTFLVKVMLDGREIIRSRVAPIKHNYDGYPNESAKFKSWAVYCEASHIAPLFQSGDTLCIDNNGKVAYAKADILSEKRENDHFIRTVRLTKELGHHETLAYEEGYPARVVTYQPDESTAQYFGGKDSVEVVIESCYAEKEQKYEDLCWSFYTGEKVAYNSKVNLAEPFTPEEVLLRLKQKALEKLLEDCRGEFCYGDTRVQKYRDHYLILGEKNIDTIYKDYKEWLNKNCTKSTQDATSGEFTGIAVDWHGKEDLQPIYDVSGDSVVVKSASQEKFKEFFLLGYYCNKSLAKPYKNLCELFKNSMLDGKITILLLENRYEPKVVEKFFKELNPNFEKNLIDASQQIDQIFTDAGLDVTDMEFDDFVEECKSRGIY
jgi:hypothetical protein